LSVYGQYAQGFLPPGLSTLYIARPDLSTVAPQTSTNYQAGFVYHGSRLSLDFDGYYIDFNNKLGTRTVSDGTSGTTTAYYNQGDVIFKSGSIRFSLVDKWTGVQYAIDETSLGGGINQLNR
jgi:iron complex outermembrane receptor protein